MLKAVLDSTILVSAFLKPVSGGASFDLLRLAADGAFQLFLSTDILDETERVLRTSERIRRRYNYPDSAIAMYRKGLAGLAILVRDPPQIRVVRDPNDDMILACAIAAGADNLVSRDHDLLSLGRHRQISIVAPEEFLKILRLARR